MIVVFYFNHLILVKAAVLSSGVLLFHYHLVKEQAEFLNGNRIQFSYVGFRQDSIVLKSKPFLAYRWQCNLQNAVL